VLRLQPEQRRSFAPLRQNRIIGCGALEMSQALARRKSNTFSGRASS
jgi:hypothetical protein